MLLTDAVPSLAPPPPEPPTCTPLTFYYTISAGDLRPYMPAVPVLLTASSWSTVGFRRPKFPAHVTERAADSGGFVATYKWGGQYRYTPAQYVDWLTTWAPSWAATMDYCCEDEVTGGKPGVVRERQDATTTLARQMWDGYREAPWAWVPTVQGWLPEDYRRHARALRPLLDELRASYVGRTQGAAFRVGVGTLCRRTKGDTIHAILEAVTDELPDVPLHLWGVKLDLVTGKDALPRSVRSVDSAAWHGRWGQGLEHYKQEKAANGLTQRQVSYLKELPRYQAKVQRALARPKQLRLPFGPVTPAEGNGRGMGEGPGCRAASPWLGSGGTLEG